MGDLLSLFFPILRSPPFSFAAVPCTHQRLLDHSYHSSSLWSSVRKYLILRSLRFCLGGANLSFCQCLMFDLREWLRHIHSSLQRKSSFPTWSSSISCVTVIPIGSQTKHQPSTQPLQPTSYRATSLIYERHVVIFLSLKAVRLGLQSWCIDLSRIESLSGRWKVTLVSIFRLTNSKYHLVGLHNNLPSVVVSYLTSILRQHS